MILLALEAIGLFENVINLKAYTLIYEIRAANAMQARIAMLAAMDRLHRRLDEVEESTFGDLLRISFELSATRRVHLQLLDVMQQSPAIDKILTFRAEEDD